MKQQRCIHFKCMVVVGIVGALALTSRAPSLTTIISTDHHPLSRQGAVSAQEEHQHPPRHPPPPWSKAQDLLSNSYNPRWLVVSRRHQLAVTIIPKVMCTSVRGAINTEECGSPRNRCAEVRTHGTNVTKQMALNMTRVLVLRDPIERAWSAYTNSITNQYINAGPECQSALTCSFEKWVNMIAKRGTRTNEHFATQTSIAQIDQMHYHYVLRMSSSIDQHFFWHILLNQTEVRRSNVSNTTSVAATNTTTNNNKTFGEEKDEGAASRAAAIELLRRIGPKTLNKLEELYHQDLLLWEAALEHGTPRVPGEVTAYDIYKQAQLDKTIRAILKAPKNQQESKQL